MKNKSALFIVLLLLFPALLLAGCGQASLNEAQTLLRLAVPEASAQKMAPPADEEQETGQELESEVLEMLQDTLTQIYHRVSPSVVNIQVAVQSSIQSDQMPSFPGMPSLPDSIALHSDDRAMAIAFNRFAETRDVKDGQVLRRFDTA